jgi:hypothetical protein
MDIKTVEQITSKEKTSGMSIIDLLKILLAAGYDEVENLDEIVTFGVHLKPESTDDNDYPILMLPGEDSASYHYYPNCETEEPIFQTNDTLLMLNYLVQKGYIPAESIKGFSQ